MYERPLIHPRNKAGIAPNPGNAPGHARGLGPQIGHQKVDFTSSIADRLHGPQSRDLLLSLQKRYGNQAVRSILDQMTASARPGSKGARKPGHCSDCSQQKTVASPFFPVSTEPLERGVEEELENLGRRAVTTPPDQIQGGQSTRGVVATLPDASMGGSVVCDKGNMVVWINPSMDACVAPCARKHEEKHIADFKADPDYKDGCKGVPDGHLIFGDGRYKSCDDAIRFEDAATDLEINCLANAIPSASAACKNTMQHRKDTTLPNYKKTYRSCKGC